MLTRRHALQGAGLAGLALALGGCSGSSPNAEDLHGATDLLTLPLDGTPHVADAATASSRIAWQLMVADEDVRTLNRAISPSSLAVTLAMLAEGASAGSLTSLDEAFGLSGDERSAAIGALRQSLEQYEDLPTSVDADDPPESPVVHQANRVVILDEAAIKQPFLDRLASYYGTSAVRLPAEEAKPDLDAWARKNTAGLIEESKIEITPDVRLITQDAVLFAARWRQEFAQDDRPLSFTTGEGATTQLDALFDSFQISYATDAGWEAIRLPYDDNLAMDVILPERGVHPAELEFTTVHASSAALSGAKQRPVDVTMPPSDTKATWNLLKPLADMGVDLSRMDGIFDGGETLQFAQQVVLTVTAKGTVGAALTEAAVGESAVQAPEAVKFVADRPFLMRVLDTRTGWPLFMSIVNDPGDETP
ncbi:serpin family protein [Tessaracoccus antarcticus]|uniref:Twin-arginine translocation signal domain-containing protein n=1 Tax=Tessaracoccus antarcticus TaxID=2479848 RepID=A0A3M0GAB4_9ACTN|nr:serpin family protein [Tessaracoccus antarcticus]RMB61910.1 twin-arginine translocation signal domain-containing protein [Tessaracoccus antarcticus]